MEDRLVSLDEHSDARAVFDALRQFGVIKEHAEGEYPDDLEVRTLTSYDCQDGITYTRDVTTTAYVVTWSRWSFYRGRMVPAGYTLVNVVAAGLAPDGYVTVDRYVAACTDDEKVLEALMLLASKSAFPTALRSEEM